MSVWSIWHLDLCVTIISLDEFLEETPINFMRWLHRRHGILIHKALRSMRSSNSSQPRWISRCGPWDMSSLVVLCRHINFTWCVRLQVIITTSGNNNNDSICNILFLNLSNTFLLPLFSFPFNPIFSSWFNQVCMCSVFNCVI